VTSDLFDVPETPMALTVDFCRICDEELCDCRCGTHAAVTEVVFPRAVDQEAGA